MRIEHAAVYFHDLEGAKDFFVTFFNATPNQGYHNRSTGFRSYFLTFQGGARLEIMTRPGLVEHRCEDFCTGYAHVAFSVGSKQAVDQLSRHLHEAGYSVLSGPRTTGDGYYECCISGFEHNPIEITI